MQYNLLKVKKFIIKLFTIWIFPKRSKKNIRNFLFYFSLADFIRFKKQNFYIVSLGHNCLPRVLTTAIKLKPRKIYGEKTCPFDLNLNFDINKTTELIETDFQNFFKDLEFDKNTNQWINKYLSAVYNHDSKLNREEFINRYKNRIKNFLDILNSEKNVYFIFYPYNHQSELVNETSIVNLYNAIALKRQGKPFKLIIISSKIINNLNNPNIIQIIEDFEITDPDWVEKCLNEYGNFDNIYTEFCQNAGKKLKQIIH